MKISKKEQEYCIINNLKNPPKCKKCNSLLKFRSFTKGYGVYCSTKCSNSSKEVINKKKKTKKERFGDENYNNTNSRKKTNLLKYGNTYGNIKKIKETWNQKDKKEFSDIVKFWWNIKPEKEIIERQEKIRKTKKKHFNDENYNNREKSKETKLERYGDENYTNTEKIMKTKFKNGIFGYQGYRGNYEGFHYDSSWELAFIKYCLQNGVEIERNKRGFIYWYQDKKHKYYPDFYLPEVDQYVEVKADWLFDDKTKEKLKQFSYKLDVFNTARMKSILKETK